MTRHFPKPHNPKFNYWNICPHCGEVVVYLADKTYYCATDGKVEPIQVPYGELDKAQERIKNPSTARQDVILATFSELSPEAQAEAIDELAEIENKLTWGVEHQVVFNIEEMGKRAKKISDDLKQRIDQRAKESREKLLGFFGK